MSYIQNENFIKTVRYIYAHIDDQLDLLTLANAVGLSVSTLKRLFAEATNKTPAAFIKRVRMEFAFRSLQSRGDSILEVALRAGFEDQSAFARRFKEMFGYSPKEAKHKLNIVSELEAVTLEDPDIVDLDSFTFQGVTEQGLYYQCAPKAWENLKNSLVGECTDEDFSGLFIGIGHDNPHDGEVTHNEVRFTAGVTFINKNPELTTLSIQAGKYARFYFKGKLNNLGVAYHYIYGKWQTESKWRISNTAPSFMLLDRFPDGMNEHDVMIHTPLDDLMRIL